MFELFYPREYLDSVFLLTPQKLKGLGVRTVIFDIDNTLVPFYIRKATEQVKAYFDALRKEGLCVCILSNSRKERTADFIEGLDIPYVYRAGKPFRRGLDRLIEKVGAKPSECLIVGDQIFTDVLVGNLNGIYSVLVKKADKKDELVTAVKRPLEKIVLFFYMRRLKNGKK